MRPNDTVKIFEFFDGLNIHDFVGNVHLDLYDCRELRWKKIYGNMLVFEAEQKLEFVNIQNDFIKNEKTNNILMLVQDEGKGFLLILNEFNYDEALL